ncbi:unnamed protein product [Vicia faba]|uniref:Uncharacterized protein n=1 Tax=Vicia faba TaxID=3906 RepID=A0AAV1AB28_VICFA|nr:unnamed protein product [Vicia faba]
METRLMKDGVLRVKYKCGFECFQWVECMGSGRNRAGELALMSKKQVHVDILSFTNSHIGWSFINKFSPIKILHLLRHGFDHAIIRIDLEAELEESNKKRRHIFIFKEVWIKDPKCEKLVGQLWNGNSWQGHQQIQVMQELDDHFKEYKAGAVEKEISGVDTLLKDENRWAANQESINTFKALEVQHNNLLQMEEVIWRQES